MSHKLSHVIVLDASTEEMSVAMKYSDEILCDLMPEYFAKSEYVRGHGEPGSIRLITMSPGIAGRRHVKERIDKVDDATKTFAYTVLGGDPRYRSFNAQLQFVPHGKSSTVAKWTVKYDLVGDNLDLQQHIYNTASTVLKTLERAVHSKKTMRHTETLHVSPEAIWEAWKNANEILCKALLKYFESTRTVLGYDGPGSVCFIKMRPAITYAREVTELMTSWTMQTRYSGTVLNGDSRYEHFSATMQFSPGPSEGTTTLEWVATYVPEGDMGPPEHIKAVVVQASKALADAANVSSMLSFSTP